MSFDNRKILKQVDFLNTNHDNSLLAVVMPSQKEGEKSSLASIEVQESASSFLFSKKISLVWVESHYFDKTGQLKSSWTLESPKKKIVTLLNYDEDFQKWYSRIENCEDSGWLSKVCRYTGILKKKHAVRISCMSDYCKCAECIKNRIWVNKSYLRAFNIYSENVYHFAVGFKPVDKITKSIRKQEREIFWKVIFETEKTEGELHLLGVWDINKSELGLRDHVHVASLPVKDFRKLASALKRACRIVTEKTGFSVDVQLIGYRKKENVFNYFSQRMSGLFGHQENSTSFMYADIMSPKEFYKNIYNTQQFFRHNLKVSLRRFATELIRTLDDSEQKCPCGRENCGILICEWLFKPPSDKTCPSCGLEVDPRDWNYQRGLCVFCTSPAHFVKYPSAKEYERTNFVLSRLG